MEICDDPSAPAATVAATGAARVATADEVPRVEVDGVGSCLTWLTVMVEGASAARVVRLVVGARGMFSRNQGKLGGRSSDVVTCG